MRDAIATVEIFAISTQADERPRRMTLVISSPERSSEGDQWCCRVALADLHRPEIIHAPDSVLALSWALDRARGWLLDLESRGFALARDRIGSRPFSLE